MGFAQYKNILSFDNGFHIKSLNNIYFSDDCIQLDILDVKNKERLTFLDLHSA